MAALEALGPLLALVSGALLALLLEAFLGRKGHEAAATASVAALFLSCVLIVRSWGLDLGAFGGRLSLDRPALLLMALVAAAGIFAVMMSLAYARSQGLNLGQLCGLLLLAAAGLMIMVSSTDWLVVFLGLEVLSVASYALTGLKRSDRSSSEAAAKYFLTGSFAGAFFVFGMALVFGATGRLDFYGGLARGDSWPGLVPGAEAGFALIVAALLFKIAAAPFHMWAPDVYEGAPTPVTAFLTVAPKAAGLAVLFRALRPPLALGPSPAVLGSVLLAAAVLTMFVGNLAALRQSSVKRMLGYSAIAHTGYLLLAVVSGDGAGLVFYLVAYAFMNFGAFAVLAALTGKGVEHVALDDLAGLGRRNPWLAAGLTVFLFSLAGFPPTAGFLAKFQVFGAAVAAGHVLPVVAAVLASLISVAYYLRVVVVMYMREPEAEVAVERENPALFLVVFLSLFGVLQLGLWPGNLLALIRQAFAAPF